MSNNSNKSKVPIAAKEMRAFVELFLATKQRSDLVGLTDVEIVYLLQIRNRFRRYGKSFRMNRKQFEQTTALIAKAAYNAGIKAGEADKRGDFKTSEKLAAAYLTYRKAAKIKA